MNELSKDLRCIFIRNGVEIWIEAERVERIKELLLHSQNSKFFEIDGKFVNVADIVGIFTAKDMEEMTRRKNGEWKCKYNRWHARGNKCECKVDEMSGEEKARFARGF